MSYIAPATKILRYPGVLLAMQRGETVWPLHAEMDLSDRCNLACSWCRFGDRRGSGLTSEVEAADWLAQLAQAGARAVTFSGGGEPTCNPAFPEIVRHAASVGLAVGVYTNGLLGGALVRAAPYCAWVYVSLDAASAAQYARLKGTDAYEAVCETVRRLAALRECGIIGIGYLLGPDNWRQARLMVRLAEDLGADYCQFRPCARLDSYAWVPLALSFVEPLAGDRIYVRAERFRDVYDAWRGVWRRGYEICRASALGPCIGAEGTVWACPNMRGLRAVGDLREESLAAICVGRAPERVGPDCETTCRHHTLNRTLALACEPQPHEEFV